MKLSQYLIPFLFFPTLASAQSYEPVAAAGDFHQVILENPRVRVLAVDILPGETVPFHQHTLQSIFVTLQPSSLVFRARSVRYSAAHRVSRCGPGAPICHQHRLCVHACHPNRTQGRGLEIRRIKSNGASWESQPAFEADVDRITEKNEQG